MHKYFIALLLMLYMQLAAADNLGPEQRGIVAYIDKNQPAATQLLAQLVAIDSQTKNLQGVRAVGAILQKQFEEMGFKTFWEEMPPQMQRAGNLFAVKQGTHGKRILLIGHLDTVFPADVQKPPYKTLPNNRAKGVGVSDMKGGDIVMLYALKALQSVHALDDATIMVALMGDEESSGKPLAIARRHLSELAQNSDVVLDFESGPPSIGRRGISGWQLKVQGKEGHSSLIFQPAQGAGAIFSAAQILNNFRTQLSQQPDLSFNPGLILGGTQVTLAETNSSGTASGVKNVIAQAVIAMGDLRYLTAAQKIKAEQAMQVITQNTLPQTTATLEFQDIIPAMPPKPQNAALLQQLDNINQQLGYGAIQALSPRLRGAGDISFIASQVPAGLAGLGPLGQNEHAKEESVDLNSLALAAKRDALLIYALVKPK